MGMPQIPTGFQMPPGFDIGSIMKAIPQGMSNITWKFKEIKGGNSKLSTDIAIEIQNLLNAENSVSMLYIPIRDSIVIFYATIKK